MTNRYLNAQAVDQLLARTSSGGTTAWYLDDHLGSVRDVVTFGQMGVTILDHLAYGNIIQETSPSNGDRMKYGQLQWDAVAGEYLAINRPFDAISGRWITQDPMAFTARDKNLYRYSANCPVLVVDPLGKSYLDLNFQFGTTPFGGGLQIQLDPQGLLNTHIHLYAGWQTPNVSATIAPDNVQLPVLGNLGEQSPTPGINLGGSIYAPLIWLGGKLWGFKPPVANGATIVQGGVGWNPADPAHIKPFVEAGGGVGTPAFGGGIWIVTPDLNPANHLWNSDWWFRHFFGP